MPNLIPIPGGGVRWDYDQPPTSATTKPELIEQAAALGLPTTGTKADLAARIAEHQPTED